MKMRYALFILFLLINGIFVMLPTAKEIQDYKRALLINPNHSTPRAVSGGRFVYNDLPDINMLKEIERIVAAHDLQVEKRSLSSEEIQDVNKITLELALSGKRADIQGLLMEEAFQNKRYRIAYLMMEQKPQKTNEKNAVVQLPQEINNPVKPDLWLTHITIYTYFRE